MFHPSEIHHQSSQSNQCGEALPDDFGMLCWNVHKNNSKEAAFRPFLKSLVDTKNIDLLLFQEANFKDNRSCMLEDFAFDGAANLEYKGEFFGVQTASRVVSKKSQAYLTQARESLVWTRKSLLLSEFDLGGSRLFVLNIHAINFRENQGYNRELDRFLEYVREHRGPMIIAGDFNSWSAKRMQKLEHMQSMLCLEAISFEHKHNIKSFMGYPLDHIFYRGLELIDSAIIDAGNLSDHTPLYARFGLPASKPAER